MSRDPTCLFRCNSELLLALEGALGPPIDSYLMGWQVWIEPATLPGRRDPVELEYRLHPPADFHQPGGLSHHDLWDAVMEQIAAGRMPLRLGEEERTLQEVWVVLEVYPAFEAALSPEAVRNAAETVLGQSAIAAGYVDHERLGRDGNDRRAASTYRGRSVPRSMSNDEVRWQARRWRDAPSGISVCSSSRS